MAILKFFQRKKAKDNKKPQVSKKKLKAKKTVKLRVKPKETMVKELQKVQKMPDEKAFDLLKRFKINVVPYVFVKNEKDLQAVSKKIAFPWVMKVSGDIVHKTEVNGVRKNIEDLSQASGHFRQLMKIGRTKKVLIQKMVTEGYELIVGGKKDPQFRSVVALGAGGIFAEVLKDVSFRICPLTRQDAENMLKEVKFGSLVLQGFRGQKPADKNSIIEAILSVSRIMERNSKIKELDINPLFATPTKTLAADVRIITG